MHTTVLAFAIVAAALTPVPAQEARTGAPTAQMDAPTVQPTNCYHVVLDDTRFGELNQKDTALPRNACGPSSVANGLRYLQNRWPEIYAAEGRKLIPADNYAGLVGVANDLIGRMKTDGGGTLANGMIDGTYGYIESIVPGKTAYAAQRPGRPPKDRPWIEGRVPTFEFIHRALASGAMVDVLLMQGGGRLHFVIVHGVSWNDANNDGVMDKTENATIHIVDSSLKRHKNAGPGPVILERSPIWQAEPGGRINCRYAGLNDVWIGAALAVRPTPAIVDSSTLKR